MAHRSTRSAPLGIAGLAVAAFLVGLPAAHGATPLSAEDVNLLRKHTISGDESRQAMDLAKRLGRESSVEGLEAILAGGDQYRLHDYLYGLANGPRIDALDPAIEALMVRYYANPDFQYQFIEMLADGRAKYRSEALFRLLLESLNATVKDHKQPFRVRRSYSLTRALVNTGLAGIEPSVLDLCPALPRQYGDPAEFAKSLADTSLGVAVNFLAQRKYAPAVPYLEKLIDGIDAVPDRAAADAPFVLLAIDRIDPSAAGRIASRHFDRVSRAQPGRNLQLDMVRTLGFLRQRDAQVPTSSLAALLREENLDNDLVREIAAALTVHPNRQGIRALVDRMARAARRADYRPDAPADEVALVLGCLASMKDPSLFDYAQLRRSLPARLGERAAASYVKLVQARNDPRAAPDLFPLLAGAKTYKRALDALLAMDSVDVWKRTRAEIERLRQRGELDDARYRYSAAVLDQRIADPNRYLAQLRQADRAKEFEVRKARLYAIKSALLKLEEQQPEQYAASYSSYLADAERLAREYSDLGVVAGLRTDIANDYLDLGHLVRFRLKQTRKAIEIYTAAEKAGNPVAALALADTYQFDLRDKAKALEEFQRMQVQVQRAPASTNDMEAGINRWAAKWIAHQIDYLKTGKPFTGPIAQEDVGGIGMIVYFGAGSGTHDYLGLAPLYRSFADVARGQRQIDRGELARKLQALPPSTFTLVRTVPVLTAMPDAESMLRYLEKHDPAGYATACFFGLVDMVDHQAGAAREAAQLLPGLALPPFGAANPLRAASARFAERRGIDYATKADPRMSSPEATWTLLISSLKNGDLETAMACLTPGQQAKFRPAWSRLRPEDLRTMAESFTGFAMSANDGDIREAIAVRGKRTGMIYFVNVGGAWKINEM